MNLKLNFALLCIGIALGAYLCKRLTPRPEAIIATQIDTKIKIVKVTEPSGKVIETTESVSSNKETPVKPTLHAYGIGIYNDKTIMGEVRLGKWPLFVIAETDLHNHRIGLKLEL